MNKSRLLYLDALKGFLMLLVIWGHLVQGQSVNFFDTLTFRTIYSFHMAVFFFVSGFLFYIGRHDIWTLPMKTIRLLVPYFAWYVLLCFLSGTTFSDFVKGLFSLRADRLWFLLTLWQCQVVAIVCGMFSAGKKYGMWMIATGVLATVVALLLLNMDFDIRHFAKYYQYFVGGVCCSCFRDDIRRILSKAEDLIVFVAAMAFLTGLIVAGGSTSSGVEFQPHRIVISWLGCVSLFLMFRRFIPANLKYIALLMKIGERSLGLYAVHFFLWRAGEAWLKNVNVYLGFVLLASISYASVVMLEKMPIVGNILLGNFKASNRACDIEKQVNKVARNQ